MTSYMIVWKSPARYDRTKDDDFFFLYDDRKVVHEWIDNIKGYFDTQIRLEGESEQNY